MRYRLYPFERSPKLFRLVPRGRQVVAAQSGSPRCISSSCSTLAVRSRGTRHPIWIHPPDREDHPSNRPRRSVRPCPKQSCRQSKPSSRRPLRDSELRVLRPLHSRSRFCAPSKPRSDFGQGCVVDARRKVPVRVEVWYCRHWGHRSWLIVERMTLTTQMADLMVPGNTAASNDNRQEDNDIIVLLDTFFVVSRDRYRFARNIGMRLSSFTKRRSWARWEASLPVRSSGFRAAARTAKIRCIRGSLKSMRRCANNTGRAFANVQAWSKTGRFDRMASIVVELRCDNMFKPRTERIRADDPAKNGGPTSPF